MQDRGVVWRAHPSLAPKQELEGRPAPFTKLCFTQTQHAISTAHLDRCVITTIIHHPVVLIHFHRSFHCRPTNWSWTLSRTPFAAFRNSLCMTAFWTGTRFITFCYGCLSWMVWFQHLEADPQFDYPLQNQYPLITWSEIVQSHLWWWMTWPNNLISHRSSQSPVLSIISSSSLPLSHPLCTKYYVCINAACESDILFTHKGGVKVNDVNAKALILSIPILPTSQSTPPSVLMPLAEANQQSITPSWLRSLYLRTQVALARSFKFVHIQAYLQGCWHQGQNVCWSLFPMVIFNWKNVIH